VRRSSRRRIALAEIPVSGILAWCCELISWSFYKAFGLGHSAVHGYSRRRIWLKPVASVLLARKCTSGTRRTTKPDEQSPGRRRTCATHHQPSRRSHRRSRGQAPFHQESSALSTGGFGRRFDKCPAVTRRRTWRNVGIRHLGLSHFAFRYQSCRARGTSSCCRLRGMRLTFCLLSEHAPVDHMLCAGNERSLVGSEEKDEVGDLAWLCNPPAEVRLEPGRNPPVSDGVAVPSKLFHSSRSVSCSKEPAPNHLSRMLRVRRSCDNRGPLPDIGASARI